MIDETKTEEKAMFFADVTPEEETPDLPDFSKPIRITEITIQRPGEPLEPLEQWIRRRKEAVKTALIDALNENGIALIQKTHECESGVIVETIFLHESGEIFEAGKLHVPAAKNDPQGYGSALTYARRYSLMASCGIAPEDDDGNAASRQPITKPKQEQKAFDVSAACNAIETAPTLEKAGYYADVALKRASTEEEYKRIYASLYKYKEAA